MSKKHAHRNFFYSIARYFLIFISLLIALSIGLAGKFYSGPFERWVLQDLGGVFYAMTWCFGLAMLCPSARPRRLATAAVAICFGLELLQLWHPPLLEVWRAQLVGHLVIGSSFAWSDFPYYAVGGALSGIWLSLFPTRRRGCVEPGDHPRPFGVPA